MPSLTESLATILARPVTAVDRDRVALHVLDWLGCAIGGLNTEAGAALTEFARRFGGEGHFCSIAGATATREAAVLVSGGLGNILEMDDLHRTAILHPGPVVIPAALALAQMHGASGEQLLDAIVRGYEAMIRVGRSFGGEHYRLWHNTSTAGPFGAAAAAGSLLGLTEHEMAHALGHAGTQSSGPWQTRNEPSMSKQLHTGRAALSGIHAAELAASGLTAPMQILEGEQGIYKAMCPDPNPAGVLDEPNAAWQVYETSFKPWPACRHAHPAIDAALELGDRLPLSYIESVQVLTYDEAVRFCDKPDPRIELEAKFSLQHAVAVCLVRGRPQMDDFDQAACEDSDLVAVRRRISVQQDAEFSGRFPEQYGAALIATRTDGSSLRIDSPDALGDPNKPISDAAIAAKFDALLQWSGVAAESARALRDTVAALPAADNTVDLINAIAAARR